MINATGIGSVPHKDVKSICNFILDKFPDIPFWPQLFKVAPTENMFMQFSENLPCLEHDLDRKTVRLNKKIRNRNYSPFMIILIMTVMNISKWVTITPADFTLWRR